MKPLLRSLCLLGGSSLLLGGDCTFGRPIVDERSRYYPSDGVISCTGTVCSSLPAYELALPEALDDSPCARDLPTAELRAAARGETSLAGMRYLLASEGPSDLNLGRLDIRDACLVLSGPVRLTIGADSKLTNVTVVFGPAKPSDRDAGVAPSDSGPDDASFDAAQGASEAGTSLPDAGPARAMEASPTYTPVVARGATPNLYLGHAELDRVVLQATEEGEPSGSAQIEFSTCLQCETRIDSLNVTESYIQSSRLAAGTLSVVGGTFDTVELSFDYGLIAGLLANDLRTAACNTLSLVGATIAGRASQIGPCECMPSAPNPATLVPDPEGMDASDASEADAGDSDAGAPDAGEHDASPGGDRNDSGQLDAEADQPEPACRGATISQTAFFAGMVDGKIHAENSSFQSVLFARHAPTALDIFNVDIKLSVVCDHPMDVRLDKTSGIGCTSCDSAETATACLLDDPPKLTVNTCKAFRSKLSVCEPPLPIRRTPFIPMPPNYDEDEL